MPQGPLSKSIYSSKGQDAPFQEPSHIFRRWSYTWNIQISKRLDRNLGTKIFVCLYSLQHLFSTVHFLKKIPSLYLICMQMEEKKTTFSVDAASTVTVHVQKYWTHCIVSLDYRTCSSASIRIQLVFQMSRDVQQLAWQIRNVETWVQITTLDTKSVYNDLRPVITSRV